MTKKILTTLILSYFFQTSSRLERKLSRRRKSEISESINDFTLTCAVTTTLYDLLNKLQSEENGQLIGNKKVLVADFDTTLDLSEVFRGIEEDG